MDATFDLYLQLLIALAGLTAGGAVAAWREYRLWKLATTYTLSAALKAESVGFCSLTQSTAPTLCGSSASGPPILNLPLAGEPPRCLPSESRRC